MSTTRNKSMEPREATVAPVVVWASAPAGQDSPAAASYLRLIAGKWRGEMCAAQMANAPTFQQHAQDTLRAARLPLPPAADPVAAPPGPVPSRGHP